MQGVKELMVVRLGDGSRFKVKITMCTDPTNDEQAISSPLLSAMEEALQSIKREMGEDHASYVSSQLQDAVKRSNELQAGLPDFSDAIDPFADMPPFDERNATAQVEDPVGSPLFAISIFKRIIC
jgi:hypothetical protein